MNSKFLGVAMLKIEGGTYKFIEKTGVIKSS